MNDWSPFDEIAVVLIEQNFKGDTGEPAVGFDDESALRGKPGFDRENEFLVEGASMLPQYAHFGAWIGGQRIKFVCQILQVLHGLRDPAGIQAAIVVSPNSEAVGKCGIGEHGLLG